MSLKAGLSITLIVILLLFGGNILVFLWGDAEKSRSIKGLEHAVGGQLLIIDLERQMEKLHKDVLVLEALRVAGRRGFLSASKVKLLENRQQRQIASLRTQTGV